jgi:hypothetical protein
MQDLHNNPDELLNQRPLYLNVNSFLKQKMMCLQWVFFFKYLVGQVKIVLSHSQILLQDTIINSLTCSNVSNPPPSFLYHCILPSPYKRKWKLSVKKFLQIWCPQIHDVLSHKTNKQKKTLILNKSELLETKILFVASERLFITLYPHTSCYCICGPIYLHQTLGIG